MPYDIRKSGDKWVTYNKETGDIKGTHSSRVDAVKQMRLLYMVKDGGKPTGKESKMNK